LAAAVVCGSCSVDSGKVAAGAPQISSTCSPSSAQQLCHLAHRRG
jgi:hypothetical protein